MTSSIFFGIVNKCPKNLQNYILNKIVEDLLYKLGNFLILSKELSTKL